MVEAVVCVGGVWGGGDDGGGDGGDGDGDGAVTGVIPHRLATLKA